MSTPAGWHPDPDNPGQLRYWDGARWTEHRAPAVEVGGQRVSSAPDPTRPKRSPAGDIMVFVGTALAVFATLLPWWWDEYSKARDAFPNLDFYRYFSDSFDAGWRIWLPWTVALTALACCCLAATVFSLLRLAGGTRVRAVQIPFAIAAFVLWGVVALTPVPNMSYVETELHTFQGPGTWAALIGVVLVLVGALIAADSPRMRAASVVSGDPPSTGAVRY